MSPKYADDLISFWRRFDIVKQPFVHPDDWPILQKYSELYIREEPKDFDAFVLDSNFGNFTDRRLRLSLLPCPYSGDLRAADIVILLLNPGFSLGDFYAETRVPKFRKSIERTLAQDFDGLEFPFVSLDPEYCWSGAFRWWEEKLRDVITFIAEKKFNGSYLKTLRDLSRRLAAIELFPYHSSSFNAHKLLKRLPSVQAAQRFAQDDLVKAANQGDKTIIVLRQKELWGIPEKTRNHVAYGRLEARGARLGRNSRGGKEILDRYCIKQV